MIEGSIACCMYLISININSRFGCGLPYRTMRLVRWSPSPFVDPEIPESATNQFGDNKFHFTLDPVLHKVFAFAAPLLPVDLTLTRVHRDCE